MRIVPLAEIDEASAPEVGGKAANLARLLRAGFPVPDGFCITASRGEEPLGFVDELKTYYARFDGHAVAVRSSATVEDLAGASSAGIYQTFLNVQSLEDCLSAIRKCWASLGSQRAVEYRASRGIAPADAAMAVIVQQMIPADAAGVAFTECPVGPVGQMLIEAAKGLGEAVVSSRVAPDRFVVDRSSLVVDGGDGCVSLQLVEQLAKMALAIEKHFGGKPQDIEWAVHDGRLYVLQARPITTSSRKLQVWSNLNAGEVLPQPVSPMSQSLLTPTVEQALIGVLNRLGMRVGAIQLTSQIAGRAYFNVNLLAGILRRLPSAFRIDLNQILGGNSVQLEELDIQDADEVSFSYRRMIFGFPALAYWFLAGALDRSEETAKRTNALAAELRNRGTIQKAAEGIFACAEGLSASLVSMRYFEALSFLCERWFPGEKSLAARLVAAGGHVDSAEAALALWRLAELAHKDAAVEHAVRAAKSREELPGSFVQAWDAFIAEHGHHAVGELDVMTPRWSENEAALLDHVRAYLDGMGDVNPIEIRRQRTADARAEARKFMAQLNPVQRPVFEFLLNNACRGAMVRENMKSALIRLLAAMRLLLLEEGERLARAGVLDERTDIFFLRYGEEPSREVVRQRRAEHEQNLKVSPPAVIVGDHRAYVRPAPEKDSATFDGLAVSPGFASGPARVIVDPNSGEQLHAGEILVAPYADPGWVPHFLQAAAIVVDLGGLLSHGSIIARELGIPAVANVGNACATIKTGQMLEVDGYSGSVRIIG